MKNREKQNRKVSKQEKHFQILQPLREIKLCRRHRLQRQRLQLLGNLRIAFFACVVPGIVVFIGFHRFSMLFLVCCFNVLFCTLVGFSYVVPTSMYFEVFLLFSTVLVQV